MVSKDMYFYDIQRCNWFASQLTKRYGNYSYRSLVPENIELQHIVNLFMSNRENGDILMIWFLF